MTVIGLWLGMWAIVSIVALKLSDVPMSRAAIAQAVSECLPPCMTNGYFIAIIASLAFYTGATLAWWRGR